MSNKGKDQLFKASGASQPISVEGVDTKKAQKISLAPCPKQQLALEASSVLTPLTPQTPSLDVTEQQQDDRQTCILQQRIAKVKRHSADISKQLDKLHSLSDSPTDNGSE